MPIRGSIANSLRTYGAGSGYVIPRQATPVIDYLMVAGGGGGGLGGGGGGGGGGLIVGSGYPVGSGVTLTFTVGGGGGSGNGGQDSQISGPGTPTITALGGGDGGDGGGGTGGSGGSGGGGGRDQPGPGTSNPTSFGTGTPNQGNRGGRGGTPPQGAAGGGGGSNGSGQDGSSNPGQTYDNRRDGGSGKSVQNDIWGGYSSSYLNTQGINGGTPSGTWNNYILAAGGGNGIEGGPGSEYGFGGSSPSWTGFPRTGGDGGSNDPARNANSACQYTGSGGGGGGANPGGGASPGGGSGSGGSIIIRYDEFYTNAASTTGGPLYDRQNNYHLFHFLGSGSITF